MKKNHFDELYKKIVFHKTFPRFIKQEKSDLGKLLLQENFIFFEIISLLHLIELFIAYCLLNQLDENKFLNETGVPIITIPDEKILFDNYTLGRLIGLLRVFLMPKSEIIVELKNYNDKRNILTHKIFDKYTSINKINTDAKKLIRLGDEILKKIKLSNQILSKNSKILVKKYHLSAFDSKVSRNISKKL